MDLFFVFRVVFRGTYYSPLRDTRLRELKRGNQVEILRYLEGIFNVHVRIDILYKS